LPHLFFAITAGYERPRPIIEGLLLPKLIPMKFHIFDYGFLDVFPGTSDKLSSAKDMMRENP
jgi:hypothetical protein